MTRSHTWTTGFGLMKLRNRSNTRQSLAGYWYTPSDPDVRTWRVLDFESKTMTDFTEKKRRKDGTLPPSNLVLSITERLPLYMERQGGTSTFQYASLAVDVRNRTLAHDARYYRPPGSQARILENNYYTQELLARTNPFRPEFSVPIAIKELMDVSSMFKIAAKTLTQYIGGNYLNYKFGWLAFVDDIRTLANLHKAISSRVREFQSLSEHGGLRRTVKNLDTFNGSWVVSNSVYNSTLGSTIRGDDTHNTVIRIYGSCRWRPTTDFSKHLSELDKGMLALQAVLDLHELDGQTAWGLIPFSWLVDYFMNFSSFLEGTLGSALVEPYDICIMRYCKTTMNQRVTTKPQTVSLSGSGYYTMINKERDVWTKGTFPVVRSSLLSSGQLLTLAALLAKLRG